MPLEPTQDPNSPPPPAGSDAPIPVVPAVAAAQRPEYIPETVWDSEKNAPKIDLAATLTEYGTLKEQADARAALIPAKPEDIKFDLPSDFEMPQGYTWKQDANDPIITGFRELATELKLTQPEVQRLVAFEARRQSAEIANQQKFDSEQTKALGEKADDRRKAASDWLTANTTPERAAALKSVLITALGVEAVEDLIAKGIGVNTRGNSETVEQSTVTPEQKKLAAMYPSMQPAAR